MSQSQNDDGPPDIAWVRDQVLVEAVRVYQLLVGMTGDLLMAEDLTQETLLKAWEQAGTLRSASRVRSWIYSIAANTGRSHLRRRRLMRWLPLDSSGLAAPQPEFADGSDVAWCLAQLSADDREVIMLIAHLGLTVPEAAAALRISRTAAEKRWQRARDRLSALLEGAEVTETCRAFDHWIAEQSGTLSALPDDLARHATTCARCRAALAAEHAVRGAVGAYAWPRPSEAARLRILVTVSGALESTDSVVRPPAVRRSTSRLELVVGAIGLVAFALLVRFLADVRTASEPVGELAQTYGPPPSSAPPSGLLQYLGVPCGGPSCPGAGRLAGPVPLRARLTPVLPASALAGCQESAWVLEGRHTSLPCSPSAPAAAGADAGYPGLTDSAAPVEAMALDTVFTEPAIHHPQLHITTTAGVLVVPWGVVLAGARSSEKGPAAASIAWGGVLLAVLAAVVLARRTSGTVGRSLAVGTIVFALAWASAVLYLNRSMGPLRTTMDALIGSRGLDPLDPTQALIGYDLSRTTDPARVSLRARYADGSERTFEMPTPRNGNYQGRPLEDPTGRLRSEHREFSGLPFGDAMFRDVSRVRLGGGEDLLAHPDNWGWNTGCESAPALAVSPDGRSFLVNRAPGASAEGEIDDEVWLVGEAISRPVSMGNAVVDLGFTTDGGYAYSVVQDAPGVRLRVVDVASGEIVVDTTEGPAVVARGGGASSTKLSPRMRPGPDDRGLWIALPGGVYHLDLPEGVWDAVDIDYRPPQQGPLWVLADPSRTTLALSCDGGLCLTPLNGTGTTTTDMGGPIQRLSWAPSGERLLGVGSTAGSGVQLVAVSRDGTVAETLRPKGESGVWTVNTVGWMNDERALLSTCIEGGRRLLSLRLTPPDEPPEPMDLEDATPPLWDAWAAVLPSAVGGGPGTAALYNGRGSLWRAHGESGR